METHMSSQTADTRFTTVLLGLFAGLGTILAVIGTYGVVAYLVAQRTQELGVRLALGASSTDILWLVLRYGLFIGVAGVALGLGRLDAGAAVPGTSPLWSRGIRSVDACRRRSFVAACRGDGQRRSRGARDADRSRSGSS